MRRWQPIFQLFLARLREFYREPEVIFWVYGFPVLLAVGLGIAFRSKEPEPPAVDGEQTPGLSSQAAALLAAFDPSRDADSIAGRRVNQMTARQRDK